MKVRQVGFEVLAKLKSERKKWPPDVAQCRPMSPDVTQIGGKRQFWDVFGVLGEGWIFLAWEMRRAQGLRDF